MNNRIIAFTLISTLSMLCNAGPEGGHASVIHAPVVSVDPITEWVTERTPHERCHDERVKVIDNTGRGSATPALIGAALGGTLGGAIGHNSRYQPVIAGAGALLGASIGRDTGRERAQDIYYTTETSCTTEYEVREYEHITGYRVGYSYGGNTFYTRTRHDPGASIRVRVALQPLE